MIRRRGIGGVGLEARTNPFAISCSLSVSFHDITFQSLGIRTTRSEARDGSSALGCLDQFELHKTRFPLMAVLRGAAALFHFLGQIAEGCHRDSLETLKFPPKAIAHLPCPSLCRETCAREGKPNKSTGYRYPLAMA